MQEIYDRGIAWSIKPFQETDALVTMLTKNHGKMNILMKGLRSQKSKRTGTMQPFSCITFSRTQPKMSKGLSRMVRSELKFQADANDPVILSQLCLLTEVCRRFLADEQVVPGVFELWEDFLKIDFEKPLVETCGFLIQFFTKLGLFPNFQKCTKSGVKFKETDKIIWENGSGVFCSDSALDEAVSGRKNISFSQLKSLFFFQHTKPEHFSRLALSASEAQELMNIIFAEIRSLSEKPFLSQKIFTDLCSEH